VAQGATPTGHAIIAVDDAGENAITLFAGANRDLAADRIAAALGDFGPGDTLLLQNEVNLVAEAARLARDKGLRVVYSAAPFDAQATAEVVPFADILVLNEVEATQLDAAAGPDHVAGSVPERIITRGERGATWTIGADDMTAPAFAVDNVVDTTGAGDCFAGYLVAGLDAGLTRTAALRRAQAAAAIQITRAGAAAAIPRAAEVDAFLSARG